MNPEKCKMGLLAYTSAGIFSMHAPAEMQPVEWSQSLQRWTATFEASEEDVELWSDRRLVGVYLHEDGSTEAKPIYFLNRPPPLWPAMAGDILTVNLDNEPFKLSDFPKATVAVNGGRA